MEALQHKLEDTEDKKEHAETQYQKLLERVNTIRSQLGDRLKEDAVSSVPVKALLLALMFRRKNCPR